MGSPRCSALASAQCGAGVGDEEATASRASRSSAVRRPTHPAPPSSNLEGPQGTCSSVLIAPTLRRDGSTLHCSTGRGCPFVHPRGQLLPTGSGGGEIGSDDAPSALRFFSAASAARMAAGGGSIPADAVGVRILSTKAPSICCDDLAFVVLDHPIAGLAPASVRIDRPTEVGESVFCVRLRSDGTSHGPHCAEGQPRRPDRRSRTDEPTSVPQAAPLRSLRIGPGVVTCNGDSGVPCCRWRREP